jgi:two-component system sensor kinase FixL
MQDSPRRELLLASAAADNDMVQISVADTGSGIAPDVLSQLFQPFVTTKQQGMGVGLSICRTIVESHGGRLWLQPLEPCGTMAAFCLPCGEPEGL